MQPTLPGQSAMADLRSSCYGKFQQVPCNLLKPRGVIQYLPQPCVVACRKFVVPCHVILVSAAGASTPASTTGACTPGGRFELCWTVIAPTPGTSTLCGLVRLVLKAQRMQSQLQACDAVAHRQPYGHTLIRYIQPGTLILATSDCAAQSPWVGSTGSGRQVWRMYSAPPSPPLTSLFYLGAENRIRLCQVPPYISCHFISIVWLGSSHGEDACRNALVYWWLKSSLA